MKTNELTPEVMNKLKQDMAKSLKLSKLRRAIAEEEMKLERKYQKKIKIKQ